MKSVRYQRLVIHWNVFCGFIFAEINMHEARLKEQQQNLVVSCTRVKEPV